MITLDTLQPRLRQLKLSGLKEEEEEVQPDSSYWLR